jgi:hypothetical protein
MTPVLFLQLQLVAAFIGFIGLLIKKKWNMHKILIIVFLVFYNTRNCHVHNSRPYSLKQNSMFIIILYHYKNIFFPIYHPVISIYNNDNNSNDNSNPFSLLYLIFLPYKLNIYTLILRRTLKNVVEKTEALVTLVSIIPL